MMIAPTLFSQKAVILPCVDCSATPGTLTASGATGACSGSNGAYAGTSGPGGGSPPCSWVWGSGSMSVTYDGSAYAFTWALFGITAQPITASCVGGILSGGGTFVSAGGPCTGLSVTVSF